MASLMVLLRRTNGHDDPLCEEVFDGRPRYRAGFARSGVTPFVPWFLFEQKPAAIELQPTAMFDVKRVTIRCLHLSSMVRAESSENISVFNGSKHNVAPSREVTSLCCWCQDALGTLMLIFR